MIDGGGHPHNIADRSDGGDVELTPIGARINNGHRQGQIPALMSRDTGCKIPQLRFVVFTKLLDPLSLVHIDSLMGMSRQLDRSAFRTAELEIEAGCILLSALLD
jgi:hypothetical protein